MEDLQRENERFFNDNEHLNEPNETGVSVSNETGVSVSEGVKRLKRLFIFSCSDKVSSDVYIRGVIESIQTKNSTYANDVQQLALQSSSHVQHLKMSRHAYYAAIRDWLASMRIVGVSTPVDIPVELSKL